MPWLKNVLLDIAVLIVIALYAFQRPEWAWWIIAIYTPLMLLLKVTALSSGVATAVKARSGDDVPTWFHHAAYGINVLLLLYAEWWWAASGWAAIWVISAIAESRSRPTKKN